MKKALFLLWVHFSLLHAESETVKKPEQIQIELNQAELDFEIADKMFIPWYTGPLIAGSANNVPPGHVNMQPYLYLTLNYGAYNQNWHSFSTPNTYVISPLLVFQTGITNWLDFTIVPQAYFRWEQGQFASNFGDFPIQFGFQIAKETPYIPSIRLLLGELFPTGKYQHLNPKKLGLDATGVGAYQTTIGLNISKIFWWIKLHPLGVRFAGSYAIPDHRVDVHDYNAFGGGKGTDGSVHVGNTLNLDIGLELSITQRWVIATDIMYARGNASSFSGTPGTDSLGSPALIGVPSNESISFAPAIEYNVNESQGFIGGIWFSAAGRNSPAYVTLMLSYTAYF